MSPNRPTGLPTAEAAGDQGPDAAGGQRGGRWRGRLHHGWAPGWTQPSWLRRLFAELARVELIDRSLALAAQALLALVPLLMLMTSLLPPTWAAEVRSQVRDTVGIEGPALEALQRAHMTGSASAAQAGAIGLVVAVVPLVVQAAFGTLIWWWTAHLLLGGRVPWRRLLPSGLLVSVLLATRFRPSTRSRAPKGAGGPRAR